MPYQHCDRVKDTTCRDVPRQECNDEPYQDCRDVQRERCVPESWQDCQDYPRQECKDIHQKVPKQVAVQVPIRVCGQSNQYDAGGQFDGTSLFDIRSDNDPENDAEEFDYNKQQENIDPGLVQQTNIIETKLPTGTKKAEEDDEIAFVFGDK